jgi:hypothetical protein
MQRLQLLAAGLTNAPTARATVRRDDCAADFDLPVWVDNAGRLRVALPKVDPQHSSDHDQLIVTLDELLTAAGGAIAARRARDEEQPR